MQVHKYVLGNMYSAVQATHARCTQTTHAVSQVGYQQSPVYVTHAHNRHMRIAGSYVLSK